MQGGGDVQVPTGAGMDRAGFQARNPNIAPAQPQAAWGREARTAAPTTDTERAAREAPRQSMLRSGNSFGDAASAYSSTMPQSAQNQGAVASMLARTPNMPGGSEVGAAPAPGPAQTFRSGLRQGPELETPQMEMPSLQMANGGNFLTRWIRGTATGKTMSERDATIDKVVAPPAPAPPPPAPPMREIRFQNGGNLRTGMGGHVPGEGKGDKIDAKYEPGEFVVSNDMLDMAPGLREQLHGLRGQALAAKGMTPEEADAKAIVPGGLRAVDGLEANKFAGDWLKRPEGGPTEFTKATAAANAERVARAGLDELGGKGGYADHFKPEAAAPASKGALRAAAAANSLGKVLRVAAPAMEAKDVYDVASDPNSTKIDVGTQVAEGSAKLASAALGAKGGAVLGAPLGPVGAAVGGLAGGAAGYFGGEKLIGGLRSLTGSDPRSPDEQISARAQTLRAPAAPAQAPAAPAQASTTSAQAPAPAQLGDSRNTDEHAGTMEVFTKGNGNIAGWTTVSTPAAKEARALRNQQYEQRQRQNFEDATTGPLGWKTREAERQAREDAAKPMYINARKAFNEARGQDMNLRGQMAQIEASRANNAATNAATLRGQDMGLQERRVASQSAAATAQRAQENDDRKFKMDVARLGIETANKNRDDKRAAESAFDKRIEGLVGVDKDGKPDAAAAAQVRNAAIAHMDARTAEARELLAKDPNNKSAQATLELIDRLGVGALGDEDLHEFLMGARVNRLAQENDGVWFNPWAGKATNTNVPARSLRLKENMFLPNQYVTDNGQSIPASAVEANPDLLRLRKP